MFERLSKVVTKKSAFFALFLVLTLFTLTPHVTHAQIASGIENILWTLVNVLFGWLVWVGGMLLDTAINDYVIGFGDIYATKGLGFTIDGLWVVVRDIFNLTFIFGLVFIGLKMIFGSDSNTKKLLVSLILAALLVNFSLFITKFVVDFSNIAAVQLVNAFPVDGVTRKPSVSGEFNRLMGITGLWNTGSGGYDPSATAGTAGLGYILGTMILYVVAAFVFLGGGLLLMIRFVVLNIYIVLSPLMFIGWVFPSAAKYTSEYWSGFLSRCFFAPAYILMLYFAQKILSTFSATAGGTTLSSIFSPGGSVTFAAVVPPFVLTSVFLIAALVVAQKMGATGASGVMAAGKQLSGRAKVAAYGAAGGAVFGGSARAAQSTIGFGAKKLSNSASMQRWAANNKGFVGRAALKASNKVADSSFDGRSGLGLGSTFGSAIKGGYSTRVTEKTKADEAFIKTLSETKVVKVKGADGKEKYADEEIGKQVEERLNKLKLSNDAFQEAELKKLEAQAAIANNQPGLSAKLAEKQALEAEINVLEQKRAAEPFNAQIIDDINTAKGKLSSTDSELKNLDTNAKAALSALEAAEKNQKTIQQKLIKQAETSVKYQNQLAYIETRQGEANFKRNIITKSVGAIAGTSATGMGIVSNGVALGTAGTLGVTLGAGAVAGIGLQASGASDQDSVDNLRKKYGDDGLKMDESEEQLKNAKSIAEQLKKLSGEGDSAAKEVAAEKK